MRQSQRTSGLADAWFTSRSNLLSITEAPEANSNCNRDPLHFAHKCEGLTVLNDGRLFVVHDDDRVTGRAVIEDKARQFSETQRELYSVIEISNISP